MCVGRLKQAQEYSKIQCEDVLMYLWSLKKMEMLELQKTLEICITIQDAFIIEDLD